jgi:hypothetical protein
MHRSVCFRSRDSLFLALIAPAQLTYIVPSVAAASFVELTKFMTNMLHIFVVDSVYAWIKRRQEHVGSQL